MEFDKKAAASGAHVGECNNHQTHLFRVIQLYFIHSEIDFVL